jgi:tetratricopeptide (TPR) repeat protein
MLNPKYSETYKVKGRHLYHQKNFESSLIAFTQANSMNKDLGSFVGIIESNIALGKYKDAANCAREMVLLYQKSAEVFYVMGTVLGRSSQGANEVSSRRCRLLFLSEPLAVYSRLWKGIEDSTENEKSGSCHEYDVARIESSRRGTYLVSPLHFLCFIAT